MDQILSQLIEQTEQELEQARDELWPEERNYIGFREHAEKLTDLLIQSMFSRHGRTGVTRRDSLSEAVWHLDTCLVHLKLERRKAEEVTRILLNSLPEVRRLLQTDLQAAYAGDPAARSLDEVILCYPAFTAISTYRLAHILYLEGVPLLPRVMTEYAHRLTGIDIHPGATIGESFFIDHGTGVDDHREERQALPACDARRQELCRRGGRDAGQGHQTPPGHRRPCRRLFRRDDPGRPNPNRE